MPIGKNAIKRVENNGYSKVKTAAPDMENSSVIAKPDEQVVEKMVVPVERRRRKNLRQRKHPRKNLRRRKPHLPRTALKRLA